MQSVEGNDRKPQPDNNVDEDHGIPYVNNEMGSLERPGPPLPFESTSPSSLRRLREKVHATFFTKLFLLPQHWVVGRSRFVKMKKAGLTYAVLSGKTLNDPSYCFRVRRDKEEKRVFFTPMASLSSDPSTTTPVESERLPDIVTYERDLFRAEVLNIFKDAGENLEPERLDKIIERHAHEWIDYLCALRALHPPANVQAPALQPLIETVVPSENCDTQPAPPEVKAVENQLSGDDLLLKDDLSELELRTVYATPPPLALLKEEKQEEERGQQASVDVDDVSREWEKANDKESRDNGVVVTKDILQLQDIANLQRELETLKKYKNHIMEENRCLNDKINEVQHERDSLRERVDSLSCEVTELRDCIDTAQGVYLEQISSLQGRIEADLTAVAEEVHRVAHAEDERNLQAEIAQLSDALAVSQQQCSGLLTILDLRERQLASERARNQERELATGLRSCRKDELQDIGVQSSGDDGGAPSLRKRPFSDFPLISTMIESAVSKTNDDINRVDALMHPYSQNNGNAQGKSTCGKNEMPHTNTGKRGEGHPNKAEDMYLNLNDISFLKLHTLKHKHKHQHQRHRSSSRLNISNRSFRYSPWRRSPYAGLGYTNETLYYQHTPDRGVGTTTLPPKTGLVGIASGRSNGSGPFQTLGQKARHYPSSAVHRKLLALYSLAQPPEK